MVATKSLESSELFKRVYDQLRALADRQFQRHGVSATLQPTALVHEVFIRMANNPNAGFKDPDHFMAVAATAMRQIIIDRARRKKAAKRGGEARQVPLTEIADLRESTEEILAIDNLLNRLESLHPRQAQVVEFRIFVGMTVPEVAKVLKVSVATVEKDWRQARAWMQTKLRQSSFTSATRC